MPRPCKLCFISRIICIASPASAMCCKFRHQLWIGFSCINSFIWEKQISCTSTTNNPTQPSVHTCKATESSPLRWMFPRSNAAVSCRSRRIHVLCAHMSLSPRGTLQGTDVIPLEEPCCLHISHQELTRRKEAISETHTPELGRLFPCSLLKLVFPLLCQSSSSQSGLSLRKC